MGTEQEENALGRLADAFGVTDGYHDGTGQWRVASREALLAVLRALGAPVHRAEDAGEALRNLHDQQSRRPAPTVATFRAGGGGQVRLAGSTTTAAQASLHLESGETLPAAVEDAAGGARAVTIPSSLAPGYHRLDVDGDGEAIRVHLLVAPERLPDAGRGWGLFAPLYALRLSRGARGTRGAHDAHGEAAAPGSFPTYGDLERLSAWMRGASPSNDADRPRRYLATLPLLDTFLDEPFEPSPYSPVSRSFWSELYVDPGPGREVAETEVPGNDLGVAIAGTIDYRRQMRKRRRDIEALLGDLETRGDRGLEEFETELHSDDDLRRFAAFRATVERSGTTWPRWSTQAREGRLQLGRDYDERAFRYHAFAQHLARRQMADAASAIGAGGTGLGLDLPLGSHPHGYDTWRYRGEFAGGVSVGAPPDAVFEGGQDWGFPPLHPERSRATLYASLRAALRHHFRHASLLRVDHVMGLHRLFWIPDGFTAADGVYVRGHADEMWSILAIEASRARDGKGAAVVGEDLGTVPEEVRTEMKRRGALRLYVVPFECRNDKGAALPAPPVESLACLGTHDMETFATWWDRPDTPRASICTFLGCGDDNATAAAALRRLLAWLSAGSATIVVSSLEDLWLERQRQNLPGLEAADVNWKRPFARTLAQFTDDPEIRSLAALLAGSQAADIKEIA